MPNTTKKRNQYPAPPRGYMSLGDFADLLGLTQKYAGSLAKREGLKVRRIGVWLYIPEDEAKALYHKRKEVAERAAAEEAAAARGESRSLAHQWQMNPLPPEKPVNRTSPSTTVCIKCGEPGNMTLGGKPYCYTHFLEMNWERDHRGVAHAA